MITSHECHRNWFSILAKRKKCIDTGQKTWTYLLDRIRNEQGKNTMHINPGQTEMSAKSLNYTDFLLPFVVLFVAAEIKFIPDCLSMKYDVWLWSVTHFLWHRVENNTSKCNFININIIVISEVNNNNMCIGDDTKAATRQSLNCIKIKYGEKRFSIWRMEFLHPAMWHVALESW